MRTNVALPRMFPVRHLAGPGWQVLIAEESQPTRWVTCESEEDARTVAKVPVLRFRSLDQVEMGEAFACELEQLATVLAKYQMNFGSRFFAARANRARSHS